MRVCGLGFMVLGCGFTVLLWAQGSSFPGFGVLDSRVLGL